MSVDEGVPVVELSETEEGGYKLNVEELENILLNEDVAGKKVAVISVAGAFRKGKSFLLNFLVHYLEFLEEGGEGVWFDEDSVLDKFHWRGGSKRDTHGIIMWSRPYFIENKHGEEVVVLLMDTQGTFDHNSTVQECATIFAMSTLLSSVQIFNISQQIQEDDLQNLQLFTEYAQLAQKNSRMAPFQKLIFLVRDWQNSEEHDYGYEGGADYVEEVLKITKTQKKELQTLRKKLGKSFQDIQGFLMPHPGLRIAKNNSETVLGEIEEDFEEQINVFVPSLFEANEIEPKMIAGNPITCSELFHLFKNYMEVFNNDELPAPKSILEATASAANQAAEESAKAEYDRIIDEFMDSNQNLTNATMLRNVHDKAKMNALDLFDRKPKLGGAQMAVKHRDNLLSVIEIKINELLQQVEHRRRNEEQKKQLEEQKRRQEEQRRRDEQKAAEERERLRREAEEQERKRREMEEKERQRQEEVRRWEAEQKRREQEAREERERLRRQAEEQERRRRQVEEEDRMRREEQRRQEEEWRRKEQQRQKEAEEAHERRLRDMKEREEQRQMEMARQMERQMMSQLFESPASSGYGSSFSSPSYSSPRPSGVRYDENVNRWRDVDSGRFARNPYAEVSTPVSAPRRSEAYFDEGCNRWRAPNGRFCKNPNN